MRLIDLDKAVSIYDEDNNAVIFTNVKNAEVKAIPIEWIKDWLETCIPHYDYDKMTYIADVYEMLEDWEKENEHKESD